LVVLARKVWCGGTTVARGLTKGATLEKDQEESMANKGYWVVCYRSVSNPAAFSEYRQLAATALKALGGCVIVGSKPAKTHEAGIDQSVVVVEFENLEKAITAYESDLYRPALKALDQAAQRDFRIVEGLPTS
jgi:uncharacterized protein (DUF1330 family)